MPADLCARSPRVYRGLEELTYPFHDQTIRVTGCGRICFRGRKVNLSHVFAGQAVGVTQVGERIWLVTFMQYDLGYFDDETCRLEPIENPFGSTVLPIRSESIATYPPGKDQGWAGAEKTCQIIELLPSRRRRLASFRRSVTR